jgi:Ca2+-binding EF-hand superfamily protein
MLVRTKILLASSATAILLGTATGAIAERRGPGPGSMDSMFEQLDADGNGKVTREEATAFRDQKFTEFDQDGSGELNFNEYSAMIASLQKDRLRSGFDRQDADKDGGLSKEELASRLDRMFSWMDKNDDGAVERTEMRGPHGHGEHPSKD